MAITKTCPKPAFTDHRGDITNLITHIQHVALITSRPGAVRGNHRHRTDTHYTYLVSGYCVYFQVVNGLVESCDVQPGEMVLTPADVPHALRSVEESVFLVFCTAERMGGKYEADTQPYPVVPGG